MKCLDIANIEIAGYDSWRHCDPEMRCYRVDNPVGFVNIGSVILDLVASRDSSFRAIGPFIIINLVSSNEFIYDTPIFQMHFSHTLHSISFEQFSFSLSFSPSF